MYDLMDRFVVWFRYAGKWVLLAGVVVLIAIVAVVTFSSGGSTSSTTPTTTPTKPTLAPAQRAAACTPAIAAATAFTKTHSPSELTGDVAKNYATLFAAVEHACTTTKIHTFEVSVLAPWYKTGKEPVPTIVPSTTKPTAPPPVLTRPTTHTTT